MATLEQRVLDYFLAGRSYAEIEDLFSIPNSQLVSILADPTVVPSVTSQGPVGSTGPPGPPGGTFEVVNTQPDDYTLTASDIGSLISLTKAAATTLTVPAEADVPFSVGNLIKVEQGGAGQVAIVGAVGVTIHSLGDLSHLSGQYATGELNNLAADTWLLSGNLA